MILWLQFAVVAGVIVFAGSNLSRYGDVIAEKTGMGRTWVGVVLMASVTSLPELIDIVRVAPEGMEVQLQHLRALIGRHVRATGSAWGDEILGDFRSFMGKFWLVKPKAATVDSLIENLRRAA